ncbi:efflux RND transporter periplasmic adaptor subunit [Sabulicella rubraurantiaca]|uniref:efflux RND transporter periplasmic adaptor subunit n=1 Tax=Sabulicella rubraurantiaca TaxID=2811429 RepID=UPI001A96A574|nr:efflux RND transporter periplasmic adaptor subunit [Sabulicella rubraurantiaca]
MNVIHSEAPKAETRAATPVPAELPAEAAQAPRRRGLWLWGLAALVAAGGGWFAIEGRREAAVAVPAEAAPRLPAGEFRLSDAESRSLRIETVAAHAFRPERVAEGRITVNEDRSTPMLSPYTGRVTRVFARPGEVVEEGAPLYEIETPDVTAAANDLLSALENAQKSRVALEQARREQARQQSLLSARATSQREVEQSNLALAGAGADLRSAEAQLEAARDKLRVLGRSRAEISEIERTRQVSGVVTVRAPLGGTVTQRRAAAGQWLSAGQGDPVFTLSDLSSMWLVAAVREMDVPMIREGQPVEVAVSALPGRRFEARIVRMNPGLDAATRRLTVMAEVQDPERVLKAEMFATFRIAVGEAVEAPAVPVGAVIFRGSDAFVWTAQEGGRFSQRHVQLGIRQGDLLQVTDGLAAGERIVTGGALFIDRAARID